MRNYYKYLLSFKNPDLSFQYPSPFYNNFNNIIPNKEIISDDDIQSDDYLQQIDKPQSFSFTNYHYNLSTPKDGIIHSSPINKIIPREHKIFNCFIRNENHNESIIDSCPDIGNYNEKDFILNNYINDKPKENDDDNYDHKGFVVVYQDDESIKKEGKIAKKLDLSIDKKNNKDLYLQDFIQKNNKTNQSSDSNLSCNQSSHKYKQIGNGNEQQSLQSSMCKIDNNIFGVYHNIYGKHKLISNISHNFQNINNNLSPITPISQSSLSFRQFPFMRTRKRKRNNLNDSPQNLKISNNNYIYNPHNNDYHLFKKASINIFEIYSNNTNSNSPLTDCQIKIPVNKYKTKLKKHRFNNIFIDESPSNSDNNNNCISSQTNNNSCDINRLDIDLYENENNLYLKQTRIKKRRKYKPDDIRKKIKARFHKTLKKKTNERLEKAGSKILFDFLPQSFICNISRIKNKDILKLTYRELLQKDFSTDITPNKTKKIQIDKERCINNQQVLKYLEKNKRIQQNSGFNIIGNLTYFELLKEFFESEDFVESVKILEKKEDKNYIKEYVNNAKEYINFFLQKSL